MGSLKTNTNIGLELSLTFLPNDKFWTLSNLKGSQAAILKFDRNDSEFSKRVENTVGKGKIAPFPTGFQRLMLKTRKNPGLLGKG